jgi:flagellar basal-body rod protein FlgG
MNSGMYSALSGDINMMDKLNIVANNLANANTVGFKKDRVSFEKVLDNVNNPSGGNGVLTDDTIIARENVFTDFTTGPMKQTGNVFHMALDGDGFFAVTTPQGTAYTRQGNFQRDKNGRLTTIDGYEVQGKGGGPISIPGGKLEVDKSGNIFVDGTNTGAINIVDFQKPYQLQKAGKALFLPTNPQDNPQPAQKASVLQGYIEDSNVNAIVEMTQIIDCNRGFESCQRVIRSYDDMAGKAIELGKPA